MTDETNVDMQSQAEPQAEQPMEAQQTQQDDSLEQAKQAAQEALEKAASELKTSEQEEEPQEEETEEPLSPSDIPEEFVTGDDYIDAGLRLLAKSASVTPSDIRTALGEFFESGDPDDINGTYIKEKFGENADFAMKLAKEYVSRIETATTRMVETVHQMAGGAGAWEVAIASFTTEAPQYLQDAAKVLADKGDPISAAQVVLDYISRSGRASNKGKLVKGGSANLNSPLSKSEFNEAYAALKKRYPNQSLSSGQAGKEMQRLMERRALAKKVNR